MWTRALLVLAFLSCSTGAACSPANRLHGITVTYPDNCSPDRKARLLQAVTYQITRFQALECPVPTTAIIITDAKHFPVGTDPNPIYIGGWYPPDLIRVWSGDNDEVPVLFHELNHRARFLIGHTDSSWSRINTENQAVIKDLLSVRQP